MGRRLAREAFCGVNEMPFGRAFESVLLLMLRGFQGRIQMQEIKIGKDRGLVLLFHD